MTARKFRVTVDGRAYEVEIEEIGPARPAAAEPHRTAHTAVPAPARKGPVGTPATGKARAKGPAVSLPPGMEGVTAPLPGVILQVKAVAGQAVKAGQVLFVLEAMKMENEITAPVGGTVQEVKVAKGSSVAVGELLAVIAP
ncbi:MAG: biotin/lipoyl-containing protein [Bacillota bacterium]